RLGRPVAAVGAHFLEVLHEVRQLLEVSPGAIDLGWRAVDGDGADDLDAAVGGDTGDGVVLLGRVDAQRRVSRTVPGKAHVQQAAAGDGAAHARQVAAAQAVHGQGAA